MNHQLCNHMLYKVLHHKNKGIEKFLLAKKELLTKNREKMLK